jgi:hypothetical protein
MLIRSIYFLVGTLSCVYGRVVQLDGPPDTADTKRMLVGDNIRHWAIYASNHTRMTKRDGEGTCMVGARFGNNNAYVVTETGFSTSSGNGFGWNNLDSCAQEFQDIWSVMNSGGQGGENVYCYDSTGYNWGQGNIVMYSPATNQAPAPQYIGNAVDDCYTWSANNGKNEFNWAFGNGYQNPLGAFALWGL